MPRQQKNTRTRKRAPREQKKGGKERDKAIVLSEIEKNLNEVLARAEEAAAKQRQENKNDAVPEKKAAIGEEDFARADRIEREKRIMMWSGVIFLMMVITAGWVFSMKKTLRERAAESDRGELNWVEMAQDFNKTIEEMKTGLSTLNSAGVIGTSTFDSSVMSTSSPAGRLEESEIVSTSSPSSATLGTSDALPAGVEELKEKLENNKE